MAKIKYDVRDVEPSREFDKPIPVGIYKMLIANAVIKPNSKGTDKMLELELEVPKGEHKGRKVWEYITLNESSEWKLRQLIDALGAKLKGTLDTDKLMGQTVLTKVKHEPWEKDNDEGETEIVVTSKVGSFLKPKAEEAEEESEEEDEPEEEEEESEEEAEEEEGEPEAEEDELTWGDLQEYDRSQLKEFIKENEADTKVLKKDSDDDIRKKIAEEFEVEIPEAEEESEEEDEPEEEEESEGEDYNEWTMPALKKELKARDLKSSGTKKALVKRLEKDDSKDKGKDKKEPF